MTVLDDAGNLLARSNEDGSNGFALDEADQFRRSQEERIKQKVIQLLERSVGIGRVDAEVAIEMTFDEVSTTEEVFDPESQVARSTQTVEENSDSSEREPDRAVSVAGNLPAEQAQGDAATTAENAARTEETVNYEISRTVRSQTRRGGQVERISVAVQVDGVYGQTPEGEQTYEPRPREELDQLETLVRSAAGLDDERGDTVSVVSRRFVMPEIEPIEEEGLFSFDKNDLLRFGELGLIAVIALLVILLGIKPALRRLLPETGIVPQKDSTSVLMGRDGKPLLVHAATGATITIDERGQPVIIRQGAPTVTEVITDQSGAADEAKTKGESANEGADDEEGNEAVHLSNVEGKVKLALINEVGTVIENRPEDAIRVIRGWLMME